jgi:hypothetical protein
MFRIPNEKQALRNLLQQANELIELQAEWLEADRQRRLKDLPTLLGYEARAVKAEARVAELEAENAKLREPAYRLPWLPGGEPERLPQHDSQCRSGIALPTHPMQYQKCDCYLSNAGRES